MRVSSWIGRVLSLAWCRSPEAIWGVPVRRRMLIAVFLKVAMT